MTKQPAPRNALGFAQLALLGRPEPKGKKASPTRAKAPPSSRKAKTAPSVRATAKSAPSPAHSFAHLDRARVDAPVAVRGHGAPAKPDKARAAAIDAALQAQMKR